jgi:hypothetical protein
VGAYEWMLAVAFVVSFVMVASGATPVCWAIGHFAAAGGLGESIENRLSRHLNRQTISCLACYPHRAHLPQVCQRDTCDCATAPEVPQQKDGDA